ncbi:MAG: hypothetical protein CM1200mP41_30790 [Gammaproteobacteria bacterium]|nr:MAG: hypothetical protein CM1200mP41_30790 [Gammaproteobacteria bacterium]
MGRWGAVEDFCNERIRAETRTEIFTEVLSATAAGIAEVVIPPGSGFIGKTLKDVSLRQRYGATALAVFRVKEVLDVDLGDLQMQAGIRLYYTVAGEILRGSPTIETLQL